MKNHSGGSVVRLKSGGDVGEHKDLLLLKLTYFITQTQKNLARSYQEPFDQNVACTSTICQNDHNYFV
jgi:hypothetical protein